MAEAPVLEREAIPVRVGNGTERYRLDARYATPIAIDRTDYSVMDDAIEPEPHLLEVPKGVTELTVQYRLKGDFYAELMGPGLALSATADTLLDAVTAVLAKTEA